VTLNDELITWSLRWRLALGVVTCRKCEVVQLEKDKNTRFQHLSGCSHFETTEHPWSQLDVLLKAVQH
jgi:Tfp pilus assembly protein PilN